MPKFFSPRKYQLMKDKRFFGISVILAALIVIILSYLSSMTIFQSEEGLELEAETEHLISDEVDILLDSDDASSLRHSPEGSQQKTKEIASNSLSASIELANSLDASLGLEFEYSTATLFQKSGAEHILSIEIADTLEKQRQGLMHRRSLPPQHGMIFVYPKAKPLAMWMKNTPLSLDMIFFNEDWRVVKIAKNTTPGSLRPIKCPKECLAVLELEAGSATLLGIQEGDRLELDRLE